MTCLFYCRENSGLERRSKLMTDQFFHWVTMTFTSHPASPERSSPSLMSGLRGWREDSISGRSQAPGLLLQHLMKPDAKESRFSFQQEFLTFEKSFIVSVKIICAHSFKKFQAIQVSTAKTITVTFNSTTGREPLLRVSKCPLGGTSPCVYMYIFYFLKFKKLCLMH